jgi:hypothetical protein
MKEVNEEEKEERERERMRRTATKSVMALPFVWRMTRTTSRARTEVVLVDMARETIWKEKEQEKEVLKGSEGQNDSERVSVSVRHSKCCGGKRELQARKQDAPFPNPFHLSISDEPPKLVLEHVSLSAERLHEPRELRRPEFSAVGLENGSEELGKEEEKRQFSIASMQSSLRQCRESGTHA